MMLLTVNLLGKAEPIYQQHTYVYQDGTLLTNLGSVEKKSSIHI